MKKILLFAALSILGMTTVNAQSSKTSSRRTTSEIVTKTVEPKVDGPGIHFKDMVIDYGVIEQNSDGAREFVFENNGTKPLIIVNTVGSCGCTVPTKPQAPIMPGETGVIGVKYATDRPGVFEKTVTVTTNASKTPVILTIKGNVHVNDTKKS